MPLARCFDSAVRHLYQWLSGDSQEDHLAGAAWNIMAIQHFEECIARGCLPTSLLEGLPNYHVPPQGTLPSTPPPPSPSPRAEAAEALVAGLNLPDGGGLLG
jgi:hypothetical protein